MENSATEWAMLAGRHTILGSRLSAAYGLLSAVILLAMLVYGPPVLGQVNGVGKLPALGWGSWTQQVMSGNNWATEANIKAQSDALKVSGLQSHGYVFINIDSGWQGGFDSNGRPTVNTDLYPDGLAATVQFIHNNGQKAGIYWIPGIQKPVYQSSDTIYGTSYLVSSIVDPGVPGNAFSYGTDCCDYWHMKIDFTKPGAQQYVNSVVNQFASWGFDAIKLDGVTPGSDDNDLTVDNRAEVQAWSKAIVQSGRPIEFTLSWALDHYYRNTWLKYANARRVEEDVNCYCSTETTWSNIAVLFPDLELWQKDAGPTLGWNDFDSLPIGNGAMSGLTDDERQSTMTLWAIANSPMIVGDDLTHLDKLGLQLLSNGDVIAVDQSGAPGLEIAGDMNSVWASPRLQNGTYNVALFNLSDSGSSSTVSWSSLGIKGSVDVFDLWAGQDLGTFQDSYSATLNAHASALLRITPLAPNAPTNLSAAPGNASVALTWTASAGAATYNIYRGASSGAEASFATGITSTSYIDSSVTNGAPYYYDVTAVNAAGESDKSTEVSATPTSGFTVTTSTTSLSFDGASGTAVSILTIVPNGDARKLTFSCLNLPAAYRCGFSPASVALSGQPSAQTVMLTVSAQTASAAGEAHRPLRTSSIVAVALFPVCALMWIAAPGSFKRWRHAWLVVLAIIAMAGFSACGSSTEPAKNYTFQVNVMANGSSARTINYVLTVQQ